MTYTPEQMKIANSTSRNSSAIGMKAITPKYVNTIANALDTILDFGAGKAAAHTVRLREEGLNVTAYEFGDNVNELHDRNALTNKYDIVYASNVLNVQQSINMLDVTLSSIQYAVDSDGGVAVMNYPLSPRKIDLTPAELEEKLNEYFTTVERVGGTKQAPLFKCTK